MLKTIWKGEYRGLPCTLVACDHADAPPEGLCPCCGLAVYHNLPRGVTRFYLPRTVHTKGDPLNAPLHFRDELDQRVIQQVPRHYGPLLAQVGDGDVVLDLGAHIGAFARLALQVPGTYVVSVEPDAANFEMLKSNRGPEERHLILRAAATRSGERATLYRSAKSTRHSSFPIVAGRAKEQVHVRGLSAAVLFAFLPQVVKVDIEGGEYALFDGLDNDHLRNVRAIGMELHWTGRPGPAARLARRLDYLGYATAAPLRLPTPSRVATTNTWVRA